MAKRRANGEGNLRKRKDGRWEGRYTAGHDPETGKAIYRNVLGRTQAEARTKLKQAIEEAKQVDLVRAKQYTVGEWMDVWFENYAKVKVRPSSHQTYRGYIDNHIKPNIGKIPLGKLTSLELQKFYKKLLNSGRVDRIESKSQPKGLSAKTVRNLHQIVASAMKLAKEQNLIATDPTDGCALPKAEHREMKTMPVEQLASFLREARDSGVFELYYVELATGLRRGSGGTAENKKRLPHPAPGKGYGRRSKSAEKESGEQSLGVSRPHGWSHVTRQRAPHAPPSAETGGTAQDQVPRSEAHVRNAGPPEWSGRKDGVRDVGALQRWVYLGHLRPCDHLSSAAGGGGHGTRPIR